jgi:glycosyltransferase involved in cell wall biosynthesis
LRGEPIRLLVLANKAHGLAPGQRFRFEQWAPRLERDHNIKLDLAPFESAELSRILYRRGHVARKAWLVLKDFLARSRCVEAVRDYDAVLVFREAALIGPAIYENLIARSGVPMIFDFDDAIWMHQPTSGVFSRLHFLGKTKTICRMASAVTAGNSYLAAFAAQFNDDVSVVPTTIELSDYPVIPEPRQDPAFIVCWTGSTWTLPHFEQARAALELVATKVPLVVKIICNNDVKQPIQGAEMRFVPWSATNEAKEIGDCHAGIMPLPDDPFAKGKCGLKALQLMATGRPVVISPIGVNNDIVRSGENGFLASTTQEWVDALMSLAGSAELRLKMGQAGRATVERDYSAQASAAKFAEVVRRVTN